MAITQKKANVNVNIKKKPAQAAQKTAAQPQVKEQTCAPTQPGKHSTCCG